MESNKSYWIAGALGGVIVVGGLLWYLNSSDNEVEAETVKSSNQKELTYEELLKQLKVEIVELKNVEKMDGSKLSTDYLLNIFYVLTKYSSLSKMCLDEESFNERIQALKDGNETKYDELRRKADEEEAKHLQDLQNTVFNEFDSNEQEYVSALQASMMNPRFNQRMQESQSKITHEVQNRTPKSELPAGLDREKALEIRDFAKQQTQKTIMELQSKITNQNEFNQKFMYEVSKLDDIIYLKYGFKNTDVLKAFQHYNLIPNQANQPMQF